MLKLVDLEPAAAPDLILDEYVPLTVRFAGIDTVDRVLSISAEDGRSLVEVALESATGRVARLKLTAFGGDAQPDKGSAPVTAEGSPRFDLADFKDEAWTSRSTIAPLSLYRDLTSLRIAWGEADQAIACGRSRFFLQNAQLTGFGVAGLETTEIETLGPILGWKTIAAPA